jgi:double-stranded uracil-DNA glycosylase
MSEHHSVGFPPVSSPDARILILGSLPGVRSLSQVEYYAQHQNAFWRIMGELYGAGPDLEYRERLHRLVTQRVALWDVVRAGTRPGSLDSAIVRSSIEVNDFAKFFGEHPHIELICFNGGTAADLYKRRVLPGLSALSHGIVTRTLPSTSPAFATMRFADKLRHWAAGLSSPHPSPIRR